VTCVQGKAINLIIWVIIAVFAIGLIVTIIKAYWLWLVLILGVAAVMWFGIPLVIRLVTTRTWHK